jgi:hypothetical protein
VRIASLALFVVVLASPLAAQDGSEASAARTPENAQKFLNVVAQQYPIQLTTTVMRLNQYDWNLSYKPVRITSQDRCVTIINGDVYQFFAKDGDGNMVQTGDLDPARNSQLLASRGDLVTRWKIRTAPYVIDWAKVSYLGKMLTEPYIQATKSWTELDGTIGIVAGETQVGLYPPDKEIAQRLMLAMQTLKAACDKTEGLGF